MQKAEKLLEQAASRNVRLGKKVVLARTSEGFSESSECRYFFSGQRLYAFAEKAQSLSHQLKGHVLGLPLDFGGDDLDDLLPVPLEVCILVKGDSKGKIPKKLESFVPICGVGVFLKWVVCAIFLFLCWCQDAACYTQSFTQKCLTPQTFFLLQFWEPNPGCHALRRGVLPLIYILNLYKFISSLLLEPPTAQFCRYDNIIGCQVLRDVLGLASTKCT